jgi:hypothetical protein
MREAHMKAFNEMMERREPERKAYDEKMRAKWEANRKKRKADFEKMMTKWKADRDKRKAERKADKAKLEAIQDKTYANYMRLEPETEHQEKMDAWIADTKNGRKERTACQEVEANPEKIEPNLGEQEAVVERQEIPNEKAANHSVRACRRETMACQETPEACLECEETISVVVESDTEHQEVSKEYAAVVTVKAASKQHRDRHLAAGRSGKPKELTRGDCGSRRKLAAAYMKVSRRARMAWRKRNIVMNNWTRDKVERGSRRVRRLRKTADAPGRQNRNKGPGRQTAALSE